MLSAEAHHMACNIITKFNSLMGFSLYTDPSSHSQDEMIRKILKNSDRGHVNMPRFRSLIEVNTRLDQRW